MNDSKKGGRAKMKKIGDLFFPDIEEHFQKYSDDIGAYQSKQRRAAYKEVRNFGTAVDIGANVGIFSIDFASRFKRVIAIEPLDENIECLKLNTPANVEILQRAIGDRPRGVSIFRTRKSLGHAFVADHEDVNTPANANAGLKPHRLQKVPMITLDSLNLPELDLLKIDIQGAELIALRGALETIKRCRPVILTEEKPTGNASGSRGHIDASAELLMSIGMVPKDLVGSDRVYAFEDPQTAPSHWTAKIRTLLSKTRQRRELSKAHSP